MKSRSSSGSAKGATAVAKMGTKGKASSSVFGRRGSAYALAAALLLAGGAWSLATRVLLLQDPTPVNMGLQAKRVGISDSMEGVHC